MAERWAENPEVRCSIHFRHRMKNLFILFYRSLKSLIYKFITFNKRVHSIYKCIEKVLSRVYNFLSPTVKPIFNRVWEFILHRYKNVFLSKVHYYVYHPILTSLLNKIFSILEKIGVMDFLRKCKSNVTPPPVTLPLLMLPGAQQQPTFILFIIIIILFSRSILPRHRIDNLIYTN